MPKIEIRGTRGEVNLVLPGGKVVAGSAEMDEIVVGVTRDGSHPIALAFEDVQDMNLFTIDLSLDQADEFGRAVLEAVYKERARLTESGRA